MPVLNESVTPQELARAWEALRAGQFRTPTDAPHPAPSEGGAGARPGPAWWRERAVVAVVGGHGWSGASTTALLLAHTYAADGAAVRLLDVASPARSGLVAAARTEHGLDATDRWRVGSRGAVQVHRPAQAVAAPADLPDWDPDSQDAAVVTVLDSGWPIGQLLQEPCWVGRLLGDAPVVLTGRATALGVRHVEATLAALHGVGVSAQAVALIGRGRHGPIPARLTSIAGPALTQAIRARSVVMLPDLAALAGAGVGVADLPRRLTPAGRTLTRLIGLQPDAATGGEPGKRPDHAATPTGHRRYDSGAKAPPGGTSP